MTLETLNLSNMVYYFYSFHLLLLWNIFFVFHLAKHSGWPSLLFRLALVVELVRDRRKDSTRINDRVFDFRNAGDGIATTIIMRDEEECDFMGLFWTESSTPTERQSPKSKVFF